MGFPGLPGGLHHLPGPSISPKRTPMTVPKSERWINRQVLHRSGERLVRPCEQREAFGTSRHSSRSSSRRVEGSEATLVPIGPQRVSREMGNGKWEMGNGRGLLYQGNDFGRGFIWRGSQRASRERLMVLEGF